MKKLFIIAALTVSLTSMAASPVADVSEKAQTTFHEVFKGATNVSWTVNDNLAEANFTLSKVQVKATIDNNGNLIRTIRYYQEANLPPHIRYQLDQNYSKQDVWGVTEISNANNVVYRITLRDNKNWYNVISDAYGNMEIASKYKRADK